MAIDSLRLLTDSAAQIWQRLSHFSPIEVLQNSDCFEDWIHAVERVPPLDHTEEQLLRREYRRFLEILTEIETLTRSRTQALELVRARSDDLGAAERVTT
ncbi:hypothetical protein HC891_25695 [Candidatus Gracilibacteria bacterium]|nr:hypothetical protein [Candidatus Gracilibacteria bacterium]